MLSRYAFALPVFAIGLGLALSTGCEPRKKPAQNAVAANGTTTATAGPVPVGATTTAAPTGTNTAVPTATTTAAPTATPTAPPTATTPPAGTWPAPQPGGGLDPNILNDIAKKAAELGLPGLPGAVPGAPAGDPIEGMLKASAAKHGPGFTPASPIGRAKLKQGEHAGMNFQMQQGKCYIVVGAGAGGVTQLGLHLLFPATPPNASIASDTANGAQPVLGAGKPLCPPIASAVRVDTVIMQGAGDVGVQVWVK